MTGYRFEVLKNNSVLFATETLGIAFLQPVAEELSKRFPENEGFSIKLFYMEPASKRHMDGVLPSKLKPMSLINADPGEHVRVYAARLLALANKSKERVVGYHNGTVISADPDGNVESMLNLWHERRGYVRS